MTCGYPGEAKVRATLETTTTPAAPAGKADARLGHSLGF